MAWFGGDSFLRLEVQTLCPGETFESLDSLFGGASKLFFALSPSSLYLAGKRTHDAAKEAVQQLNRYS
jgi:hypothetical protein